MGRDLGGISGSRPTGQAPSGLVAARIDPGRTVRQMFEASALEGLIEDVTAISRAVRYVEVAPVRLFDASLLSELADASDRLAAKVADLQERQGASR